MPRKVVRKRSERKPRPPEGKPKVVVVCGRCHRRPVNPKGSFECPWCGKSCVWVGVDPSEVVPPLAQD